ncbi:methyltransferase domain-containing protein [Candidatus Woesebacteria bacterium]|nr:methyltransferase domain-containing protein [Candidatus Woesebacteria bacterium]
MSQPYTVAYMTSLLLGNRENEILRQAQTFSSETQARRDDKTDRKIVSTLSSAKDWKVLEIGTGSGYQAAVLSDIVPEIYTVEIIPELYRKAKKRLRKLGYKNIHVKKGNGEFGWQEHAPYDRIIITAALEKDIPDELFDQLRVGGAIVAPIGSGKFQTMTRFTKLAKGNIKKEEFGEFIFVPFVTNK